MKHYRLTNMIVLSNLKLNNKNPSQKTVHLSTSWKTCQASGCLDFKRFAIFGQVSYLYPGANDI